MKTLTLDDFFGYLVGAGVVYSFWMVIDLFFGKFDWIFFFVYWDAMFLIILLSHWFLEDEE